MANNISNLMFRAMYRFGFKPWDSGIPPPELKELIEGPQARTPGKALDLGCGTGTNTMYMAQHGWDVTGIDFVSTAIAAARKKMQAANVAPRRRHPLEGAQPRRRLQPGLRPGMPAFNP